MTRVLGVIGSPRKGGNTDVLVSAALEGAKAEGAAVEAVHLGEMNIEECDGCHACWSGGECRKDDDMADLFAKVIDSDAFIFGTPVYWYAPTALMKAFIDRLVYFNGEANRPKIRGKSAAVVIPFEESGYDTAAPVTAFFERCLAYLEMELAGRLLVPGVTRLGEVREHPGRLAEARELGRRLAGASPGEADAP